MIIKVARSCGFCSGVSRAIRLAETEIDRPVYLLGELIHNEYVLNRLAERGIAIVEPEQAEQLDKGTLIIRAHGVSPEVRKTLNHTKLKIVDATCPNVLRIHMIVKKAFEEGMEIIIIGDPDHPEVIGINGCADNRAVIIGGTELPALEPNKRYVSVVQTTFPEESYNNILSKLKNNINSLVNYNTICYTTKVRQLEAEALSRTSDTVFVIGSVTSSNTRKLFELCTKNCPNTYLIGDKADLTKVTKKSNIHKLGVTTGASTPKELVMEVILGMSNEVDSVVVEDCANEVAAVDTTATEADAEVKTLDTKENADTETTDTTDADTEIKSDEVIESTVEKVDAEVKVEEIIVEEVVESAQAEQTDTDVKATEVKENVEAAQPVKKQKISSMEDVMKASVFGLKEGKKVKCIVLEAGEAGILVNFGGKKDGFIESDKTGLAEYNPQDYKVGDSFYAVVVENKSSNKEYIMLDKRVIDEVLEVDKALLSDVFELKIDKAVKGGLLGRKGSYTVFIPASQVDLKRVEDDALATYVGKILMVSKLPDKEDSDNKRKRIVASHKAVLWAEKKAARDKAEKEWQEKREKEEQEKKDIFHANIDRFEVNNVVPGIVKRFTSFGAFVNVYGFDCLAPKGELSWDRDVEPADVLEIGKEYEFVIIKVDAENYKISLSYKLLQERPKSISEIIAEKYHPGMVITGKVQTLAAFGAFVSLEPRIDGLVHVSNISDKRINAPSDVLKVGDEIQAKIISVKDNRIALSIKDVNEAAEEGREDKPTRTKRFEKLLGDKKPRKSGANDWQMPKEEEENIAEYGATAAAKNTVLSDLLKGFEFKSDGDNKSEDDDK